MKPADHMGLRLYIPVNFELHGLLEAKVFGTLNPMTLMAHRPTMPKYYDIGDKRYQEWGDPRIEFIRRLTTEEQTELAAFMQRVSERILRECYPGEEQT